MRNKKGNFKTPYTRKLIITYLKSITKSIGKSPTYRDLRKIPGPAASTVIRHFGTWSKALKAAGVRPQTNQLMKGEKGYIRKNWRKMSDKEIAKELGITPEVIKYYRMQFNLWKNRKGTSKQGQKSEGMRLYGKNCEICNLPLTELHHLQSHSNNFNDWCILCPNCHAVLTRKLVIVKTRKELKTKLFPYIKNLYKNVNTTMVGVEDNGTSSI